MGRGLFELLARHKDLKRPIVARLKVLGLYLCANLPPAFRIVDLRYLPPDHELPSGYYFVVQYKITGLHYGFCLHEEELNNGPVQHSIDWIVQRARVDANRRIILPD